MKIKISELLEDLIDRTHTVLNDAEQLLLLDEQLLNQKADSKSWSALECIEHLNRYGRFYLPEIKHRIEQAKEAKGDAVFHSGWLGNYFAKSMLPKEQLNKMKTFKNMNPLGSKLDKGTLQEFISQQKQMLTLLDKAAKINLQKTKTAISISKWIKLRLGDTFRVVIYHNQRHLVQANRAVGEEKLMEKK